jgi:NAD(P)-dependent dehydrogenase (short-subunit alcohol dehydrogenase family)
VTHLGQNALAVPTDVGSRQSIDHLVAQTVQAYGRVDGVVNVAGIGGAGIIGHASDDVLEQMVMINLLAPARLIQAALPFMKHDGSAAIVNIGSIAVSLIEPGYIRTALTAQMKGSLPGPELVAHAVARVLERPHRALVVPASWRLMLLGVRLFPAIADRLLGSEQGQARIHISG